MTLACAAITSAYAGTITVTSPARGSAAAPTLVGETTTVQIRLAAMKGNAKVTGKLFKQSDGTLVRTIGPVDVAPDGTLNGTGSLALTFAQGSEETTYRLEVRAQDVNNETTYNADQNLFVKPDVTKPKFLQWNPISSSFVKGIVPIRVRIKEDNLQDWRVQIDNQDIPNNSGTTVVGAGDFTVNWDTTAFNLDGTHAISIRVRDKSDNEATLNINVTIDRVAPGVTIQSPRTNTVFAPGTTITVTVDVTDSSPTAVDVTGVDVVVKTTGGVFVTRVSRLSYKALGGNTMRWTGRIRWVSGQLPKTFKIEASAVDKAGNRATLQAVTCSFSG